MDIVAAIAAANGLLSALDYLLDEETKMKARRTLTALVEAGPSLEKLEEWTRDTLEAATHSQERRMGLRAQQSNPAFLKASKIGTIGKATAMLALAFGLCIGAAGCVPRHGEVLELEETEEYLPGYFVVWPEDVMNDATAFQTELDLEGRWVTSVPKADATTTTVPTAD